MAGGSWGNYIADSGETVFVPVSFDLFCLEQLGYIEPVEVAADGTYDVSTLWSDEATGACASPPAPKASTIWWRTASTRASTGD